MQDREIRRGATPTLCHGAVTREWEKVCRCVHDFVMLGVARDDAEEGCRDLGIVHSKGFGVCSVWPLSARTLNEPGVRDTQEIAHRQVEGQSRRTEGTIKGKATTVLELGSGSGDEEAV